jgi:4-carboxymuconolactone decarboxylase
LIAPARPSQYRIVLRGECGELIATALADFKVESGRGWTTFIASVRDESELYGLLDLLEDFALHVVSVNELGAGVLRPGEDGRQPADLRRGNATSAEWLRGAAAGDPAILEGVLDEAGNIEQSGLDVRAHAMVRLAALVAAGESGTAYLEHIATALDHGVTLGEIVGVLASLVPMVGRARVTAAAAATLEAISCAASETQPVGRARKT